MIGARYTSGSGAHRAGKIVRFAPATEADLVVDADSDD